MYLFDPLDVQARLSYYGMTGSNEYVPSFRYDGKKLLELYGTSPHYPEFFASLHHLLDSLLTVPSPLRINIKQSLSAGMDTVYVSFDVVAVDTIIYDTTPHLYMAVVENGIQYLPDTTTWHYVFRAMLPTSDGQQITIQKGDSLHFDWSYAVNPAYKLANLYTDVWVQNRTVASIPGKERNKVLQCASDKVVSLASITDGKTPALIRLSQNSPNPFRGQTTIAYELGQAGKVRLSVYAPTGQLVANLVDAYVEPGSYTTTWNGLDRFGKGVGSGVYYYRLETNQGARNGRMVFLK